MLIVPELKTVIILIPRTGSGSLRRAIEERYPQSMLLYRHMEADGIPAGYDRWRRLAVIRRPLDRMWSLYKFMQNFDQDCKNDEAYRDNIRRQAALPFDDWLLNNEVPFTSPYDSSGRGRYWPQFTVRHAIPENRKSQWMYARPDLGTELYHFSDRDRLEKDLDIKLDHHNGTLAAPIPQHLLTEEVREHVGRLFAWDENWSSLNDPDFKCDDCIGMADHGCYCQSVGIAP